MTSQPRPVIRAFFDEPTNTISYLVADPATRNAAVIDPVLDYDHRDGTVDMRSVDAILAAANAGGLTIDWVLETHAHADHLSGAPYIKAKTGAKIGIGEHIKDVQRIFRPLFNANDLKTDGSDFDQLFKDGETFGIGELDVEVMHTPGHTPADCPTGSATRCLSAIRCSCRITAPRAPISPAATRTALSVDPAAAGAAAETRLFMCHDYKAPGRDDYAWETTVRRAARRQRPCARRRQRGGVRRDAGRARRDAVGADAAVAVDPGQYPRRPLSQAESNGVHYLLLPVRARPGAAAAIVS